MTESEPAISVQPAEAEPATTKAAVPEPDLREPVVIHVGLLIGLVAVSLVVAAMLAAGACSLIDVRDKWVGLRVAGTVSVLAAAISIPPLLIGARYGLMGAVAGFFAASFLRLIVSLGGCYLWVQAAGIAQVPALLMMALFYFAVLSGETIVVGRALYAYKPEAVKTT